MRQPRQVYQPQLQRKYWQVTEYASLAKFLCYQLERRVIPFFTSVFVGSTLL